MHHFLHWALKAKVSNKNMNTISEFPHVHLFYGSAKLVMHFVGLLLISLFVSSKELQICSTNSTVHDDIFIPIAHLHYKPKQHKTHIWIIHLIQSHWADEAFVEVHDYHHPSVTSWCAQYHHCLEIASSRHLSYWCQMLFSSLACQAELWVESLHSFMQLFPSWSFLLMFCSFWTILWWTASQMWRTSQNRTVRVIGMGHHGMQDTSTVWECQFLNDSLTIVRCFLAASFVNWNLQFNHFTAQCSCVSEVPQPYSAQSDWSLSHNWRSSQKGNVILRFFISW